MPKAKNAVAKHTGGRPTDYRAAYCADVVECLSEGYSISGFAGLIGVSRQSIYQWAQDHPAFSDALNIAKAKSAKFWEDRHIAIAKGAEGNVTATIFALKNRVADDWREKVEVAHTGSVAVETRFVFELPGDNAKPVIEAH
jgi:transposase